MAQDDWSTQLKKIEREFDGLPPEPSLAYRKLQSEEERRAKERVAQRAALIGVFARLILVAAVGVALLFWPYENACGLGLFGFLGAEAVIVIGGVWIGITTWRARLPRMHLVSLAITLGGLIAIAAEVLPRIGYAAVDAKHPPTFSCPDAPDPLTNPATPAKSTENALPGRSTAEQRVQSAAIELHSRWDSRVSELSKQFEPHKAALARLERPELLSRQTP
ncbi:MAG TPA: hypothetical protein VFP26_02440 [Gemmatimonadaceae bacterium]|nr:hypothetical protein [Gemmatimonadaceae bacterium]